MSEVTEIIIAAPSARSDEFESKADMLLAYMEAAFPAYRFHLDPGSPMAQAHGFNIIPIMGSVGDGTSSMHRPISRETLATMYEALSVFDCGTVH